MARLASLAPSNKFAQSGRVSPKSVMAMSASSLPELTKKISAKMTIPTVDRPARTAMNLLTMPRQALAATTAHARSPLANLAITSITTLARQTPPQTAAHMANSAMSRMQIMHVKIKHARLHATRDITPITIFVKLTVK